MSKPDSSNEPGQSDVPRMPEMKPPVRPPPLPRRSALSPLAITVICLAGVIAFLTVGLGVAAVFGRRIFAEVRAADARQQKTEQIASANGRGRAVEAGLTYTNHRVPTVPWSIHVLKIDRARKDLGFVSAHARNKVLAVSLIAEQARAVPREIGRALAGVNGDFYIRDNPTYAGDPRGLQIMNGELISAPDTVCVWFDSEENPHLDEVKGDFKVTWPDGRKAEIGLNQQRRSDKPVLYTSTYGSSTRANGGRELILEREGDSPWLPLHAGETYQTRVRSVSTDGNTSLAPDTMVLSLAPQLVARLPEISAGTKLQISTATMPDLKGVKAAMGGGPALIHEGNAAFTAKTPPPGVAGDWSQRSKYERHPRTAMGWSSTHVYFVIVDGRQPGLSVGMKLAELAEYMLGLGCTEAINFDGGKSAQMWMSGRIMNSPCQGEDTVAGSLLVVRKADAR